jgi:hypothetical protein
LTTPANENELVDLVRVKVLNDAAHEQATLRVADNVVAVLKHRRQRRSQVRHVCGHRLHLLVELGERRQAFEELQCKRVRAWMGRLNPFASQIKVLFEEKEKKKKKLRFFFFFFFASLCFVTPSTHMVVAVKRIKRQTMHHNDWLVGADSSDEQRHRNDERRHL